jgi:hypothetical protein
MPSPQAMAGVVRPARISNHPALARTNATPPYLRRGATATTGLFYPSQVEPTGGGTLHGTLWPLCFLSAVPDTYKLTRRAIITAR